MTSHLKQLSSWRSPSSSGDEDALVVIKQFTDGDDQNALEVMDAIKQFADEDEFQDDLNDSSSSPSSNYSETNYSLVQEWEMCPRIEDFRPCIANGFYGPAHVSGSPLEHQASTTPLSPDRTNHSPPPPPYYQQYSMTSPLPPSPTNNSTTSQGSPCSVSPGPHTPLSANGFDTYPSHCPEYTSGMVLMGHYQVCMNYLPPYGGEWSPLTHTPIQTFSCDQVGSPSQNIDSLSRDCSNVEIFTQSNGLHFYKDAKCALEVMQPFLARQKCDNSPQEAKTKKSVKPKPRKVKPQVDVDIGGIKDIATSSQLWEFTLKILERPSYSYMVSWENKKEGVFRFHNAQAFATLWGRHRNRPNMTYDKVARALRYYYKRDILNQVGGRLTYKFSKRLHKMFSED